MQINNLARDNLHDKLGILSELVTDEFWPWFGNYMVVKRAAQVGDAATSQTCTHAGARCAMCLHAWLATRCISSALFAIPEPIDTKLVAVSAFKCDVL